MIEVTLDKYGVAIGQVWQRADGTRVVIEDARVSQNSKLTEYLLVPVKDDNNRRGRKSWKWSGGIVSDLKLLKESENVNTKPIN
jgi:hypothetical protein